MGSRLHGNDGAAAHPTIVIPATATAGFHGQPHRHSRDGGNPRRWVPVSTGTTGRRRRTPQSSFPQQRESTGGGRRWVPVSTGTTGGGGAPHNRHSRDGGNPHRGGGPAMGSRLHGNDGPAAAHPTIVIPTTAGIHGPTSSFPRRRESTAGGRRWVPVSTGTTGRQRRTPTIVIPATAGIHGGGRRWVPVSTGTTGRRRRTPQSSFPRRRGSRDPGARPPPPSFTVGSLASRVESTRHSGPRAGIQGWGGQARWRAAAADTWSTSGRLQRLAPPTCPCRLFHRDPAVTSMRPCTAGLW